jgi:hypothetical protein
LSPPRKISSPVSHLDFALDGVDVDHNLPRNRRRRTEKDGKGTRKTAGKGQQREKQGKGDAGTRDVGKRGKRGRIYFSRHRSLKINSSHFPHPHSAPMGSAAAGFTLPAPPGRGDDGLAFLLRNAYGARLLALNIGPSAGPRGIPIPAIPRSNLIPAPGPARARAREADTRRHDSVIR